MFRFYPVVRNTVFPVFIIGNGSNLLVSDSGIDGAVISLSKMNTVSVNGCEITCLAGATLSAVCRAALSSSLTGAEFAYGIPGTAGGALYMKRRRLRRRNGRHY